MRKSPPSPNEVLLYRCLDCGRKPGARRTKSCPFCGGNRLKWIGWTTRDMLRDGEYDQSLAKVPAALNYLKQGRSVIPVILVREDGKLKKRPPPGFKWEEFQTRLPTVDEVRTWWGERYRGAGIALVCGAISGVYVVDVDPRNGGSLNGKSIPQGPLSKTLNGGRHHFFRSEVPLGKHQEILKGIDFVGEGSYVVLPPSFGGRYEWLRELDGDLPELPEWVIKLVLDGTHHPKGKRKKREGIQRWPPDNQARFLLELNTACIERKLHWPLAIWAELRAFDYQRTKGRGFVPGEDAYDYLFDARGFSLRTISKALQAGKGDFWTLLWHGPFFTIQLHSVKRVCESLGVEINITPGYGHPHWQTVPLDDFRGDKRLPHIRSIACYEARDTKHRISKISRPSIQDRSCVPPRTQVWDADKLGLLQPTKRKNGRRKHGQPTYTPNEQEGPRFLQEASKNLRGAAYLGPVGRLATVKHAMEGSRLNQPGREGDPVGSPSVTASPRPWKYFWTEHRYQQAVKRAQKGIVGAPKVDCNPEVEMPRAERRDYKLRHEVSLWRKPREPANPVCV